MEFKFINFDPDFFIKEYEKIYSNVINYYLDLNKAYEKFIGISKIDIKYRASNPEILPTNVHDICNYVARYGLANSQIQTVMKLDGRLDFEKLSRAVRLSIDEEPVFGCRFVEGNTPYWKRIDNIDEISFCSFEETRNLDGAVKRFLESPLDMDKDSMIKIKLIRSGTDDTLCVKINHTCCDGGGTKEYIQLLSKIYTIIDKENEYFPTKPRIAGRKDQDRLLSTFGIKDPRAEWKPLQNAPRTMWAFPWNYTRTDDGRFVVCRFPHGQLDVMSRYGKARGATINDLILTAYYRAMFEFSQPLYGIPMDISTTVDLRQYLPDKKTKAIRNFSGGFITRIERVKDEPFERTLSRVVKATNKIKNNRPGLQNAIGGEVMKDVNFLSTFNYFKIIAQASALMPQYPTFFGNVSLQGLSNLGFISKSLIKFGNNAVTDAYVVPPAIRSPGFLILACTYDGILTLSTSYYEGSILRKDVERLLNMVKNELMQGCE